MSVCSDFSYGNLTDDLKGQWVQFNGKERGDDEKNLQLVGIYQGTRKQPSQDYEAVLFERVKPFNFKSHRRLLDMPEHAEAIHTPIQILKSQMHRFRRVPPSDPRYFESISNPRNKKFVREAALSIKKTGMGFKSMKDYFHSSDPQNPISAWNERLSRVTKRKVDDYECLSGDVTRFDMLEKNRKRAQQSFQLIQGFVRTKKDTGITPSAFGLKKD